MAHHQHAELLWLHAKSEQWHHSFTLTQRQSPGADCCMSLTRAPSQHLRGPPLACALLQLLLREPTISQKYNEVSCAACKKGG